MKKNISQNINYFGFSGTLFIGLIIGLFFPDIDQGFQNLPDEIRSTLSLREYDGLSYEEIAKVQNCPIGTVRSRIFKGRELINETFSKLGLSKTWSN